MNILIEVAASVVQRGVYYTNCVGSIYNLWVAAISPLGPKIPNLNPPNLKCYYVEKSMYLLI